MLDDDVTKKSGIYPFILTREQSYLAIRAFTPAQKNAAYEKQNGVCPLCGKQFPLEEMEGDHIRPWAEQRLLRQDGEAPTADASPFFCAAEALAGRGESLAARSETYSASGKSHTGSSEGHSGSGKSRTACSETYSGSSEGHTASSETYSARSERLAARGEDRNAAQNSALSTLELVRTAFAA
ncbi:HNH endonuclease, partial [Treponema endosymbiont of Eucomonympha sp.]|uniref:HNH endonuclease n=1 Tax=Treponema endosymbiont of Eucomonympha sp. TaxID=1580831 RepID=UPI001E293B66